MRRFIVVFLLLVIFFIFPLQVFIIGDNAGIGIQGAVYRYQITGYGNSLIPVTQEIMYVVTGIYSGKTALSILLWALGTVLLTITTWFGLTYADAERTDYFRQIGYGLTGSCVCFVLSVVAQYGFFLRGPAGMSIPFGIGLILVWLGIFRIFPDIFSASQEYIP
jgi:hypothetical protein